MVGLTSSVAADSFFDMRVTPRLKIVSPTKPLMNSEALRGSEQADAKLNHNCIVCSRGGNRHNGDLEGTGV